MILAFEKNIYQINFVPKTDKSIIITGDQTFLYW